jgi:hypothetical protein
MTYFSAIMPIADGMGLVFAVTSYDGKIIISPTSCREQIPDPEFFALCIRESFQEYLELASRRPSPARRKLASKSAKAGAKAKGKARAKTNAKAPARRSAA